MGNGDSKRTNDRDPFLVGSLASSCRYKRFLSYLGSASQPSTKHYFPHLTLFHFINPHRLATWAGRRAGLPVCVSGTIHHVSLGIHAVFCKRNLFK